MDEILKVQQAAVKDLLYANNISHLAEGLHKNILRIETFTGFHAACRVLFAAGYDLVSQRRYSKKHNVSKQVVNNWVIRDGRLSLIYYDDGARYAFVVDSVG